MSQYIEDFKGGKIMFNNKTEEIVSKMSGDQLQTVLITKYVVTAITFLLFSLMSWGYISSIVDRLQPGYAIVTTTTQQTVNYPNSGK